MNQLKGKRFKITVEVEGEPGTRVSTVLAVGPSQALLAPMDAQLKELTQAHLLSEMQDLAYSLNELQTEPVVAMWVGRDAVTVQRSAR